MRKLALLVGSLILSFNAFAATQSFNAQDMANAIVNPQKVVGSEKGSFAIVYGGQDISTRTSLLNTNSPTLVG
jgi:hypothetical protein